MNHNAASRVEDFDRQAQEAAAAANRRITEIINDGGQAALDNLAWLIGNMPPYFFITMKPEKLALGNLAWRLGEIGDQRRIVLEDRPDKLTLALRDEPGSIYDTLISLRHRPISYAEMTHSLAPLPGSRYHLEIQRFEFDLKSSERLIQAEPTKPPAGLRKAVTAVLKDRYPDFNLTDLTRLLSLLLVNNRSYVDVSPPERIARGLWLYQQAVRGEGLFVGLDEFPNTTSGRESRLLFSVINPPNSGFLAQVTEVFQRLDVGVRRFYCLGLNTEEHSAMLGSFYIVSRNGQPINRDSDLYAQIKTELYSTRILSPSSQIYDHFTSRRKTPGEETALINAFITFCHTSLAHRLPDRFDLEVVKSAFCAQPDITQGLVDLFKFRFDPEVHRSPGDWEAAVDRVGQIVKDYNTGHRNLDQIRQTVFRTCLLFIKYTLKTNFFIQEKQALAFRLDPAYLADLGSEITGDLPAGKPFRVTFFMARDGFGYHIGFSDIARGGWRTIISVSDDEYLTNTESLFRETFVLAHTQHLKNKDIYEGGSKMALVFDARSCDSPAEIREAVNGLQHCVLNAFLDVFVTADGSAVHPRVVDYYGDDEPIELGPDENLSDSMVELIARQSVKRGYVLGTGLISSKRLGINHKEFGVTSRGVVKTAIIAMSAMNLDPDHKPFTVRFTGGPGGDVAGNAMRLLIDHHPGAKIVAIVDGPGAMFDHQGVDGPELRRLTLREDITAFNVEKLNPGGYIVYRNRRRREELRNLHLMLIRTEQGLEEKWITSDEYQRCIQKLTFSLESDLFLPCGGRPETIDDHNWRWMITDQGNPATRLIVEGANSFLTPTARDQLQNKGVTIIRDASANKCGVIASSYEIIANLLMTDKEFAANKTEYVKDVLAILDRRATEETSLIFRRRRALGESYSFTRISVDISREINDRYTELFHLFQNNSDLAGRPIYHQAMLNHMPAVIGSTKRFRSRLSSLPEKVKCAILASEIASMITYRGGWDSDLGSRVTAYLKEMLV